MSHLGGISDRDVGPRESPTGKCSGEVLPVLREEGVPIWVPCPFEKQRVEREDRDREQRGDL